MFFNERCRDDLDINITNQNVNTNTNDNLAFATAPMMQQQPMMEQQPMMGNIMSPVIEQGRERVVNRTFIHEVPQE